MDPLSLSVSEQFEKERFTRIIDDTYNRSDLKKVATMLLEAWITQKAATRWALQQSLPARPRIAPPSDLSPHA